jgi:hypothetical protein
MQITLQRCNFTNNASVGAAGAVSIPSAGVGNVTACLFENNVGEHTTPIFNIKTQMFVRGESSTAARV